MILAINTVMALASVMIVSFGIWMFSGGWH